MNVSRDYGDVFLQRHISTHIATPAVMIDRSIYTEGDFFFPEGVRNGEDDQLYTKLSSVFQLGLVEEPLLKVRMRGTNSQTHAIERFHLRASNYRRWIEEKQQLTWMIHFIYSFFIQKDSPANTIVQKSAQCQLSDAPLLSADIVF